MTQTEQIIESLKVAKTRIGVPHRIVAAQSDLLGNLSGIVGAVTVKSGTGSDVEVTVIWDQAGRYPQNSFFDLVVESPLALFGESAPEVEPPQE